MPIADGHQDAQSGQFATKTISGEKHLVVVAAGSDGEAVPGLGALQELHPGTATGLPWGYIAAGSLTTSFAKIVDLTTDGNTALWIDIGNSTDRPLHIGLSTGGGATAPTSIITWIFLPGQAGLLPLSEVGAKLTEDVYVKRPAGAASTGDGVVVNVGMLPP